MHEDDETVRLFIEESQDHLNGIEQSLLEIEAAGENMDLDLVNQVFRAIHSVKGGAGFFGFDNIKNLAHDMENVLNRIREGTCVPTSAVVGELLESADLLTQMVNEWETSNDLDVSDAISRLQKILEAVDSEKSVETADHPEAPQAEADAASPEVAEEPSLLDADATIELDWHELATQLPEEHILYRLEVLPEAHIAGMSRSWDDLLDRIRRGGQLLKANRRIEGIAADAQNPVLLAVATVLEKDMLSDLLELPVECIHAEATAAVAAEDQGAGGIESGATAPRPAEQKTVGADASSKAKGAASTPAKAAAAESTLRVNVRLLDKLMNLAGELVLTRNQIAQSVTNDEREHAEQASQRLDLITTEMQEAIMSTRMQPVAVVFSKFRRIVRDMAGKLGKQIDLVLEGEDVELDKALIEGLSDPLTHLVRNSVDHGIELPSDRGANGKQETAQLVLRAYHEAGQVIIEIEDDGRGIDPTVIYNKALESGLRDQATLDSMSDAELVKLIFAPGFSTAKEVTDISGRGVGMDVVNTNLSQLGGIVDIESFVGVGTTVRIKLPLTLAIIPSLMVRLGQDCFALPQVNVQELVRVPQKDEQQRLQTLGDALVLRLRGDLIPVISLRALVHDSPEASCDNTAEDKVTQKRAKSIVVVQAGSLQFGMIVDELLDSEEIVVKPLDEYLKKARIYAGATIRGDGRVAMILDVVELARYAQLDEQRLLGLSDDSADQAAGADQSGDLQNLVLFTGGDNEVFAVPVHLISRIEKIPFGNIEQNGRRRTIVYRGGSLTIFSMDEVGSFKPVAGLDNVFVLVFAIHGKEIGLMASSILDTVNMHTTVDEETFKQPGIFGSTIIRDQTTFLVDLYGLVENMEPDWVNEGRSRKVEHNSSYTLLIAEDSKFFLNHMTEMLQSEGYCTLAAEDGVEALELLRSHPEIACVLTDIEMPNMDGLELTRAIRSNPQLAHLPVIAVTSMAGDVSRSRGMQAGVDKYLIKLDKEEILENVYHYVHRGTQLEEAG